MEPVDTLKALAPRVVRRAGEKPLLCLVNPSDRYRLIKKGMHLNRAYPIDDEVKVSEEEEYSVQQVCEDVQQDFGKKGVQSEPPAKLDEGVHRLVKEPPQVPTLPEHLEQVFNASKEHLTQEEGSHLANLFIEYQDVFA